MDRSVLCFLIGALSCLVLQVSSVSVWKDVTLSQKEKSALEKFKTLTNNTLPHEWMEKDIYLIKWLRSKNMNIPEAERALKQHLNWRKDLRMDTVHEEDFGLIPFQFPYTTNGVDKEGKPALKVADWYTLKSVWEFLLIVIALNAAEWDIRRLILSGQTAKTLRWAFRAFEVASRRIRVLQKEGQNVTQFIMLCNFDGFNLAQHVCPECVSFLVNFLASYEVNYPGMADKIIAIKTPATFQILLRALQTVMSQDTRDAIRIWGPNKNEWQKNLLTYISPEELDPEFGGVREPEIRR